VIPQYVDDFAFLRTFASLRETSPLGVFGLSRVSRKDAKIRKDAKMDR